MTNPLFPRPIAHRGLHDRANGVIENSAAAFEAAMAANFAAIDCRVSSAKTRSELGWNPTGPGLLEDIEAGHYFR